MTIISLEGYLSSSAIGHMFKNCMLLHYSFFKYVLNLYGYWIVALSALCCRHIQGSSLEGPIPSSISALTSLSDLYANCNTLFFCNFFHIQDELIEQLLLLLYGFFRRISDLKGRGSTFPPLSTIESLKTLWVEFVGCYAVFSC